LAHYTTERTKHPASNIIHYTTDQATEINAVKKRIMSHNKRREKNATNKCERMRMRPKIDPKRNVVDLHSQEECRMF